MIPGTGAVILLSLMCCTFIFCVLRAPSIYFYLVKLFFKGVLLFIVVYILIYMIFIKIPQYLIK